MQWWAIKDPKEIIIPEYCSYYWRSSWEKLVIAKKRPKETIEQTEKRLEKLGYTYARIKVEEVKESGNN